MCGFAGFTEARDDALCVAQKMVQAICHRGPDATGFLLGDDCTLGFCRLAILDLRTEGNQPMQNEDGTLALVCNGEIYNHASLRASLMAKGHRFVSRSDAEVILHGYESYGTAILEKLRGMFAFVLYDRKKRLLFGANDLFGIKPFYYTQKNGQFYFASEAKALFCHPSIEKRLHTPSLLPYLSFQYSAPDQTFFAGVKKLPPASRFSWQDGTLRISCYDTRQWEPDCESATVRTEKLRCAMAESVALHAQSDVPLGAFLSGGVDSGYLCALLRPQHTFSVGFAEEGRFDETPLAERLAKRIGACHHNRILCAEECFDALSDIQYHMDEPSANPSAVPLWFLAKEAKKHVTVVLSGEGADELFGGYEAYCDGKLARRYKKLPKFLRRTVSSMAGRLPYFRGQGTLCRADSHPASHYLGQACIFSQEEARAILREECCTALTALSITKPFFATFGRYDELTQKQALDLNLWLPRDILLKADKMSMASSLELRVPYLDKEIFALARHLRTEERIEADLAKAVLRYAARAQLTKEEAFRQKKGFPVPIRYWLRQKPFYDRVAEEFSSQNASLFFDRPALLQLLTEHASGRQNCQRKIWCIYCFLVWYRRFFSVT